MLINSIIERHSKLAPLSETEIRIVKAATKLFLENGFSKTTYRMIAEETGIGLGTITYHFKAKEDLLRLLVEELMDYHLDIIEDTESETSNPYFACAKEVAIQIALCELNPNARDLYYSAYNHPQTFNYIKEWAAKKNYYFLREKLPHFDEAMFRKYENITSAIEFAAFAAPCDRFFTLEDKILLILDSIMKIYDIPLNEREEILEEIKVFDYKAVSLEMFSKFVKRLDGDKKRTIREE